MDEDDREKVARRGAELFDGQLNELARRTDRMFAWLMALQWALGLALALWVSPRAWSGLESRVHLHVYAAVFLGGGIAVLPIALALLRPGEALTRQVIAVGQMLYSALLIHLTGGRIETHFHVFGSLAFLAFYRDWRVLATATLFVALDHGLRGLFWPQSVYGIAVVQPWRFLEHTTWVAFENAFLCLAISRARKDMRAIAVRQAELELINRRVEREVVRRTAELARSNAELEQFAYAASHDLQEPLRKVINFTQLLSQRNKGRLDEDSETYIARAADAASRMSELIASLLKYSRIGNGELRREPVDATNAVRSVLGDLDMLIRDNHAQVAVGPLPVVQASRPQFVQLFQNLVGNALKFHGPETPRVAVSAERSNGSWLFRVADNGIGIDPRHASEIFVMFRRLHSRAEYPGNGIGLAISKKIVELHGGRIWVESQPGHGSCFCFTLPVGEAAKP